MIESPAGTTRRAKPYRKPKPIEDVSLPGDTATPDNTRTRGDDWQHGREVPEFIHMFERTNQARIEAAFVAALAAPERVRITSDTGGAKESKLARHDQIPTYPLHCLAEHYGAGNAKYPTPAGEKDNWRKGYNWSLSYAAMQRHANAFWSGEDIDAETGHSHLTAVAWHAFALLEWSRHPELARFDDRQNGSL